MDAVSPLGEQRPTLDGLVERLGIAGLDLRPYLDPRQIVPTAGIKTCMDEYFADLDASGQPPCRVKRAAQRLQKFVKECHASEPSDVTPEAIEMFLFRLETDGFRRKTALAYRSDTWRFWQWLTEKKPANSRLPREPSEGSHWKPAGRSDYWLVLHETFGKPTYHNPRCILKTYNALSDDLRKRIDRRRFARIPSDTPEQLLRAIDLIVHAIRRATQRRDRIKSATSAAVPASGSIHAVQDLFYLWYYTDACPTYRSPAAIRARWNALPESVRFAIAGRNENAARLLPENARGYKTVTSRIYEARSRLAANSEDVADGRLELFKRWKAEGLSWPEVSDRWCENLSLRQQYCPTRPLPMTPVAVAEFVRTHSNGTSSENPHRFRGTDEGSRELRKWLAQADATPADTLKRTRLRPSYELDRYILGLNEEEHRPAAEIATWLADLTPTQLESLCPRFATRHKAGLTGATFPAKSGMVGRGGVPWRKYLPGVRTRAEQVQSVHSALTRAKMDREVEQRCLALLAAAGNGNGHATKLPADGPMGERTLVPGNGNGASGNGHAPSPPASGGKEVLPHGDTNGNGYGRTLAAAELDKADKADKADTRKNFTGKLPVSCDVADLCRKLQQSAPLKHGDVMRIALEFVRGHKSKAKNLLRQARRYRHLWKPLE